MITELRPKIRSIKTDPWDANQDLSSGTDDLPDPTTGAEVFFGAVHPTPGFSPGGDDCASYYKGIVRAAISSGGWYGNHRIPVPWLRMIMAGLEDRPVEPELMWFEVEPQGSSYASPGIPSYNELFPSDRDMAAGLR